MATKKDGQRTDDGGTAEEQRDRAVMRGGPTDDQGAQDQDEGRQAPPAKKRIKAAGREFEVDDDLAAAFEEREREFTRKLNENSRELGELRKAVKGETREQPKEKKVDELELLWFDNPRAAAARIRDEVKAELREEYQQTEALKSFWSGLYKRHPELEDEEIIVDAVFRRHLPDLADLPTRQAQERLAELVSEELLRISRRGRERETDREVPQGRARTEAASGDRTTTRKRDDDEEKDAPKSIGDFLRRRSAARSTRTA